jgi:hypothetical protein
MLMLFQSLGTTEVLTVMTPVQIMVFTVFILFYLPCLATFGIMVRELGMRKTILASTLSLGLAICLACSCVLSPRFSSKLTRSAAMRRWMYLLFLFCLPAYAESELSGRVVDRLQNRPLAGANVRLENSYRGLVTDREGRFSFTRLQRVNTPSLSRSSATSRNVAWSRLPLTPVRS